VRLTRGRPFFGRDWYAMKALRLGRRFCALKGDADVLCGRARVFRERHSGRRTMTYSSFRAIVLNEVDAVRSVLLGRRSSLWQQPSLREWSFKAT